MEIFLSLLQPKLSAWKLHNSEIDDRVEEKKSIFNITQFPNSIMSILKSNNTTIEFYWLGGKKWLNFFWINIESNC